MRPLIIGMANPRDCPPLWPEPGSAGERLWRMTGMTRVDYLRAFTRLNLCGREWHPGTAQATAASLLASRRRSPVVVLGAATWRALRVGPHPRPGGSVEVGGWRLYYLPHPSGQNLVYNDPRERRRAGALLRRLARQR